MVSLHDELTKKLDEKGTKILMLTNEKNFAKMTKDYVDWLSSRRAQMDQVSTLGSRYRYNEVPRYWYTKGSCNR